MTPKEKANELVDNFWLMDKVTPILSKEQAKQCALIAVDAVFKILPYHPGNEERIYWNEVKKEIENL